jgi:hypothetical protein
MRDDRAQARNKGERLLGEAPQASRRAGGAMRCACQEFHINERLEQFPDSSKVNREKVGSTLSFIVVLTCHRGFDYAPISNQIKL